MATLASAAASLALPARCLIGRSRECDVVVVARDVSARHATLEWNGADWQLRDLDSRNGTWLDGHRLAGTTRAVVRPGARIRFGEESPPWVLEDASAPEPMAVCMTDGRQRLAQGGYLALPESDAPERWIYRDRDGAWISEEGGDTRPIGDREVLVMADATPWRVHLPGADTSTWEGDPSAIRLAQLSLQLSYSRDEEYVEAVAICGARRLDLRARAHHYTLLLLARRRLADRAAGAPEAEQGWVRQDELATMLATTDNHLYITIHRARTQLGELGVADAAGLVERRAGTRQLRLGVGAIELIALPTG